MYHMLMTAIVSLGLVTAQAEVAPLSPTSSVFGDRLFDVHMKLHGVLLCRGVVHFERVRADVEGRAKKLWAYARIRGANSALSAAQRRFAALTGIMSPPSPPCQEGLQARAEAARVAIQRARTSLSARKTRRRIT